ncbi:alpha/beta hydrolase family protein [Microbacterium rhizomatis]|uniref:S9 family peptidase n=1 Tax=Microbacterium rhizomatis TaxID=1631477 RepID=A0A5J5J4R6_9MICO|nr:prolyl oligopeptidase family serine peptidase [Microbacterium rhizomatis]KAA9111020.1 S9 family peptidase [Microbacterium rhizomatis]
MTEHLPYGSWPSPLTAEAVASASPRIEGARFVGGEVWWGETIPGEGGRTSVRRRTASGDVDDLLPSPHSARSRVHEYGGGAWTAADDGRLFFVEKADQRVWLREPGGQLRALTPETVDTRFGGLSWQQGVLLAIRESHEAPGGERAIPQRDIVRIGVGEKIEITCVASGSDFVAQPALSPGGRMLAWIAWDHPDMPWDRAELRVGALQDGVVREWTTVAGADSSALQPVWAGADELLYADDPTGRWNLWRAQVPAPTAHPIESHHVQSADADTGGPLWVLGAKWFAHLEDGRILAVRTQGSDDLVVIGPDGVISLLAAPPTSGITVEDVRGTRVLIAGAGVDAPPGLWEIDLDRPTEISLVRGGESPWGADWMPHPRALSTPGPRGPVHAFAYPPTNPHVAGPEDELPPYIVFVHGGPTAHVGGAASDRIAYFTSRGIGVLDVNYGGSSGYGREYRERLRGQWGIVDVEDVAAAARGLAAEGFADPARIAIDGGSAGGWTVLAAVANTDVFAAGISRYGVGDARALAADTHDFEARYLDGLIGPLPEAEDVYIERSPLTHPERFTVPLLLLQGADDAVVPPAQSESIRDALAARGVPHAYVLYEGEGHGFRQAKTLVHAYQTQLAFLGAVLGFEPDDVAPLRLD